MTCYCRVFEVGVKARGQKLYVVKDMMVKQYNWHQNIMYLAKSIFQIVKFDNQKIMYYICIVDNLSHH